MFKAVLPVQQVAAERTSTVKSNYSVRLCRWLPVVYGSVQKVWCWKRKQYNEDSLYSENLVLCCIVPSEGVFTNSMPLPIIIINDNNQPTSISVSYLCHSKSFPNSRSAGQWAYHTAAFKTASKCIHAPFCLKTSQERYVFLIFVANGYDAFSFSFYVSSYANTCLQKNKSLGMGQACFHNQGLPYSSCMDIGWNDEIKFCPTCFPQFFSEVASTV